MKPADLARYYLRFYAGLVPADNAPIALLRLHNRCKHTGLLHRCLSCIESSTVLPDPSFTESLAWLARNPEMHTACDEYLRSKKGKKTDSPFMDSVIAAYSAEQLKFYDIVLKTLQAELRDTP